MSASLAARGAASRQQRCSLNTTPSWTDSSAPSLARSSRPSTRRASCSGTKVGRPGFRSVGGTCGDGSRAATSGARFLVPAPRVAQMLSRRAGIARDRTPFADDPSVLIGCRLGLHREIDHDPSRCSPAARTMAPPPLRCPSLAPPMRFCVSEAAAVDHTRAPDDTGVRDTGRNVDDIVGVRDPVRARCRRCSKEGLAPITPAKKLFGRR
jgi:hypothetical protein